MVMTSRQLRAGRCYLTAQQDVRKIVEFEGSFVRFVVRRNGVFQEWNKRWWAATTRADFARDVIREVGCDWRAE
jgi:hypothetical protein